MKLREDAKDLRKSAWLLNHSACGHQTLKSGSLLEPGPWFTERERERERVIRVSRSDREGKLFTEPVIKESSPSRFPPFQLSCAQLHSEPPLAFEFVPSGRVVC